MARNKLLLFLIVFMLVACGGGEVANNTNQPTIPNENEGIIVIGDISDDPGEVIEGSQPLADYLAERLGEFGIGMGQVKVAATADEMARMLEDGEVDIYFDSVYPATLISDATGAQPFLRRWRFGVENYYSIIFTKQDSGIESVDDLGGKVVAFDNPFSTSGYMLPAVHLIETGFSLIESQAPASDQQIGIIYSYDDENTLQWVLTGRAAAGATDDYNFNVAFPEEARAQLMELVQTESVPRQVAVARPGIDSELLAKIIEILTTAHENEEGQAVLDIFQTTKFDLFPEGIDAALERMREMMNIVKGISPDTE